MSQCDPARETQRGRDGTDGASTATLVDLLTDEFARSILAATATGYRPARELAEECGMSRPTVYRRLERLREAGLVEAESRDCEDGRCRQVFRATVDRVSVALAEDGFATDVARSAESAGGTPPLAQESEPSRRPVVQ